MKLEHYYEDPKVLHVGTCENRSYYVPKAPGCGCTLMEESGRVTMLSSDEWRFKFYPSPYDVEENFFGEDFCPSQFDVIPVPSCWQILGYDHHQYANVEYPFPFDPPYVPSENPSGAYIRYFDIDEDQVSMKNYLNFEGVDSCFYVWVNGKFVGYSQVSHSTSEFDISGFVRKGENKLAVLVLKWCDGSYLEDQDKLRMTGIFRDVYILSRPQSHIRDFYVKTTLDDNFKTAQVTITAEWNGAPVDAEVTLTCPCGSRSDTQKLENGKVTFTLDEPKLWNAETPHQYTALIKTADEGIEQKIGVRRFETKGGVFYINGVKAKFKGTNRHDSDPFTGYTISRDQLMTDLMLMKRYNMNAIRTSHYPNAPWATQLYSEYGFYVIDESDVEMHGTTSIYGGGHDYDYFAEFSTDRTYGMLCHDKRFEEACIDRIQRNVMRDKNCAGVVLWSMGNESGYGPNLEKAAAWIKAYDKDLLVHYESSIYQMEGYKNDTSNIDVFSRMYAPTEAVDEYMKADWFTKPFIQCEFVHAMGNGPGDIEDYFEQIYKYDGFTGGFVWEWCDHAVYQGTTADGREKYYYGGDWGEFPHDGNFCMDGLVYPDRTPHIGLKEFGNGARPVRAKAVDLQAGRILLQNKLDFMNLQDAVTIEFQVSKNGEVVEKGVIGTVDIPAKAEKEITVPYTVPCCGDCHVRLIYRQKEDTVFVPAGWKLGFDQLEISKGEQKPMEHREALAINVGGCDKKIELYGEHFRYVFNKLTGTFDSMVKDNVTMLDMPMEFNIWRAPTDNDRNIRKEWEKAGYHRHTVKVYDTALEQCGCCVKIKAKLSISAVYIQRIAEVDALWTVYNDGGVQVHMDVKRDTKLPFLPRFGLRMFLPESFSTIDYTGYGPYESYMDKRQSAYYGRFIEEVCDLHEDYIKPQENGSHWGCTSVKAIDPAGFAVAAAGTGFSFNASPYTQEELGTKKHNFELETSGFTVLCLDAQMSGIGSGSCGPQLKEKYQVNAEKLTLDFDLTFGK